MVVTSLWYCDKVGGSVQWALFIIGKMGQQIRSIAATASELFNQIIELNNI